MSKPVRTLLTLLLLIAGMSVLAACGTGAGGGGTTDGDGDGDGDPAAASRMGWVSMTEESTSSGDLEASGVAVFVDIEGDFDPAYTSDPYAAVRDTCTVYDFSAPPEFAPFPDVTFTYIDAGESITIDSEGSAAAYATLDKQENTVEGTTFITYTESTTLTTPLPDGLTATVPGAEFPAFEDVAFPDVPPFTLTTPTDRRTITVDTTFEWSESDAAGSGVVKFQIMDTSTSTMVDCTANDDGAFEFPADTQAEMGAGFDGVLTTASRENLSIVTHAETDAILFVATNRSISEALY